jgi:hypothetical protein
VFTSAHHWSISWARCIQSTPSHSISLRSILIVSSNLLRGLPTVQQVCINLESHLTAFYIKHDTVLPAKIHLDSWYLFSHSLLLWISKIPKIYHRDHQILSSEPTVNLSSAIHIFIQYFCRIHINIIFTFTFSVCTAWDFTTKILYEFLISKFTFRPVFPFKADFKFHLGSTRTLRKERCALT